MTQTELQILDFIFQQEKINGDRIKMSRTNLINDIPRGFAGLIAQVLEPINENPNFKEKYQNANRMFVLNATNLEHAAIIIVKNGEIKVKSVPNKPKSNLKKKSLGWDGFLSMDSQIFLALAMDKLSLVGVGLKFLTGKVKMKGITKLILLLKIFNLVRE